jgi:Na+/H+ antiporter NhaC
MTWGVGMKKRVIISLILFTVVTLIIGFAHGSENLSDFSPVIPPFVAIALAFITHEVVISLLIGIFVGSFMTYNVDGVTTFLSAGTGSFFKVADTYMVNALADTDHISIIIFTLFIGGVVGVIGQSGGLQGIVVTLSRLAKNSKLSQFYTWLMGIFIFFDDYANSLIVGNAMRPLTDRYRISREKLSFIVDATAAPVTSLVIISTWIGYEVGLIQDVFTVNSIAADPYMAFLSSIPYRFYVILMLIFIPISIFWGRDFSTMYEAEKRARETGEVLRVGSSPITGDDMSEVSEIVLKEGMKPRALNAIIPILVLIFGVIGGLYYTGISTILEKNNDILNPELMTFRNILGNANSFKSLIWASFLSSFIAICLVVTQKIMTVSEALKVWVNGLKSMFMAAVILTLAWSLGAVLKDIHTAEAVTKLLSGALSVHFLPLLVFLIAAITSFSTGTSWGAMAIIFPLAIPLVEKLGIGVDPHQLSLILNATIGAILSGAVFGDHCSPISDTTIMSSIASQVDHIDHVSTQLPYALMVGGVSILFGYLPAGFGFNPYLLLVLEIISVVLFLYVFGKKVENISE